MILTIDLETYSPQDIGKVGAYRYAQDPDFEILLRSAAVDDGRVQLTDTTDNGIIGLAALKPLLFAPCYTKRAWNAAFEWWCLSEYFHLTQQQREDWLDQWQDSMVHAMYCGLPASLKMAGQALQLPEDKAKMREGAALIRYFCCPCKPTVAAPATCRSTTPRNGRFSDSTISETSRPKGTSTTCWNPSRCRISSGSNGGTTCG